MAAPLLAGAVHVTVSWLPAVPAVAPTAVGTPGAESGVADADAAEAGPMPLTLVAMTVKV